MYRLSPAHIDAGKPILKASLWGSGIIAALLIGGGALLVWLGATGNTEMTLFGNTFKSQNVGIAGMFCGAVVAAVGIRLALLSLERLGRMKD